MHAEQTQTVKRLHEGEVPRSWFVGDTLYQKAAVLAAVAWSAIKDPADPELVNADFSFREQCIGVAESILNGAPPDDAPFANKVLEFWKQTAEYAAQHPNTATNLSAQ